MSSSPAPARPSSSSHQQGTPGGADPSPQPRFIPPSLLHLNPSPIPPNPLSHPSLDFSGIGLGSSSLNSSSAKSNSNLNIDPALSAAGTGVGGSSTWPKGGATNGASSGAASTGNGTRLPTAGGERDPTAKRIRSLILDYLCCEGYLKTAVELAREGQEREMGLGAGRRENGGDKRKEDGKGKEKGKHKGKGGTGKLNGTKSKIEGTSKSKPKPRGSLATVVPSRKSSLPPPPPPLQRGGLRRPLSQDLGDGDLDMEMSDEDEKMSDGGTRDSSEQPPSSPSPSGPTGSQKSRVSTETTLATADRPSVSGATGESSSTMTPGVSELGLNLGASPPTSGPIRTPVPATSGKGRGGMMTSGDSSPLSSLPPTDSEDSEEDEEEDFSEDEDDRMATSTVFDNSGKKGKDKKNRRKGKGKGKGKGKAVDSDDEDMWGSAEEDAESDEDEEWNDAEEDEGGDEDEVEEVDVGVLGKEEIGRVRRRGEIKRHLLSGNLPPAFSLINSYFPSLLTSPAATIPSPPPINPNFPSHLTPSSTTNTTSHNKQPSLSSGMTNLPTHLPIILSTPNSLFAQFVEGIIQEMRIKKIEQDMALAEAARSSMMTHPEGSNPGASENNSGLGAGSSALGGISFSAGGTEMTDLFGFGTGGSGESDLPTGSSFSTLDPTLPAFVPGSSPIGGGGSGSAGASRGSGGVSRIPRRGGSGHPGAIGSERLAGGGDSSKGRGESSSNAVYPSYLVRSTKHLISLTKEVPKEVELPVVEVTPAGDPGMGLGMEMDSGEGGGDRDGDDSHHDLYRYLASEGDNSLFGSASAPSFSDAQPPLSSLTASMGPFSASLNPNPIPPSSSSSSTSKFAHDIPIPPNLRSPILKFYLHVQELIEIVRQLGERRALAASMGWDLGTGTTATPNAEFTRNLSMSPPSQRHRPLSPLPNGGRPESPHSMTSSIASLTDGRRPQSPGIGGLAWSGFGGAGERLGRDGAVAGVGSGIGGVGKDSGGEKKSYHVELGNALELGGMLYKMVEQTPTEGGMKDVLKKDLDEVSGLLAYTNPTESPVNFFLDPRRREKLANEVDKGILFLTTPGATQSVLFSLIQHVTCMYDLLNYEHVAFPNAPLVPGGKPAKQPPGGANGGPHYVERFNLEDWLNEPID